MTTTITTASSGPYAAVGQTTFAVDFQSESVGGIEVTLDDVVLSPSLYVFTRDDDGTGEVVLGTAVTGEVMILSKPLFQQTANFVRNGPFFPDFINPPLDRLARGSIYLKEKIETLDVQVSAVVAAATAAIQEMIDAQVFTVMSTPGQSVSTRALLAGISPAANGDIAYLSEAGREGWFKFSTANNQTNVTADTGQGIYVPPTGANGSTGAWIRIRDNPSVFRVSWFGVSTANSEATNTAIVDAIFAQFLPNNVTLIFPEGVIPCRVRVPYRNQTYLVTVTIEGETAPSTWFGTVSGYTMSAKGTVLTSSAAAGSATTGGVIECLTSSTFFSAVKLVVRHLGIRTYDNPNQHGINARYAQQLEVEDVAVDTGIWTISAALPTNVVYGVRTPKIDNGAFTSLNNLTVSGYYTGADINEHATGNNLIMAGCLRGLEYLGANHASSFGRIGLYRCTKGIVTSGFHRTRINQLMFEHVNSAFEPGHWQITTYDLDDPSDYLVGQCRYASVLGNVGDTTTFTKNGSWHFRALIEQWSNNIIRYTFSNTTATTGAATTVTLAGASAAGNDGLYSVTGNAVLFKHAGYYRVRIKMSFSANATGYRRLIMEKSSGGVFDQTTVQASSSGETSVVVEALALMTVANQSILFKAEQNSGSTLDLTDIKFIAEQV